MTELVCYTDGASRGNPGPSAYAYLFVREGRLISGHGGYLGNGTNNSAEYNAVVNGLRDAGISGFRRIEVISDSELVIRQLRGEYRVRAASLAPFHREALLLARKFEECRFRHVPRSDPWIQRADRYCNRILDQHAAGK